MSKVDEFEAVRPLLFSIAYRLLGSVGEAEDAVQETWLRWEASSVEPTSVKSYLCTVVTRVAIDELRSARVRRETYPAPWFPEPLLEDPYEDPERAAELADSLSTAALLVLERLTPLERAAFVLHDVFGFTFTEIASTLERSEVACRQLVSRARRHMKEGRPRFEVDRRERKELASRFFDALRLGDVDSLRELLAADVLMVADGGGKGALWGKGMFTGAGLVVRLLDSVVPPFIRIGGVIEQHEINGQPGAIIRDGLGRVVSTLILDIADGQVQTLRGITNPDKLAHVGPPADSFAVMREVFREQRSGPA